MCVVCFVWLLLISLSSSREAVSSLIEGKIIRFVYDVNMRRNIDLVLLCITHTRHLENMHRNCRKKSK